MNVIVGENLVSGQNYGINVKTLILGILACLVFLTTRSKSQEATDTLQNTLSADFGYKGILLKSNGGLIAVAQGASCSYLAGVGLLTVRYTKADEVWILTPTYPKETIQEVSVMYGLSLTEGKTVSSVSAGLNYISGVKKGILLYSENASGPIGLLFAPPVPRIPGVIDYYEEIRLKTIGLSFQAQYMWMPWRWMGVGLDGIANLNKDVMFVGVLFSIRLSLPT